MIVTGASVEDLTKALEAVNARYDGNVTFASIEAISKNRTRFRLRVKDSRAKGAKRSAASMFRDSRRTVSACWHANGNFYDAVFNIKPDAVFRGGLHANVRITNESGNWEDWNQGPQYMPQLASDLCDCDL